MQLSHYTMLVQATAQVVPEDAIRALQMTLPAGLHQPQPPVELENVAPTLLLPPVERGGVLTAMAGGVFDLGDRVACLHNTGGHKACVQSYAA